MILDKVRVTPPSSKYPYESFDKGLGQMSPKWPLIRGGRRNFTDMKNHFPTAVYPRMLHLRESKAHIKGLLAIG